MLLGGAAALSCRTAQSRNEALLKRKDLEAQGRQSGEPWNAGTPSPQLVDDSRTATSGRTSLKGGGALADN
ncbi:hypothetical protein HMPREF9004_1757 [Schaalia cardiffensis F0333]|uniref:Uncharacterized protein n=1 Tax=Schaalia cardiffensis F0333 TaxID=888050 RepID=N6X338_9ACTO|nr:hypothetical protein HMPREF9004_1757 [Schaalia cardiffensis F0333]